jgi:CBS domain-containing protein
MGRQPLIVGYILSIMKVRDILRLKGQALYTITPEHSLSDAARMMAENDIGSLVVMARARGGHAHLSRGDPGHGQERRQLRGAVGVPQHGRAR